MKQKVFFTLMMFIISSIVIYSCSKMDVNEIEIQSVLTEEAEQLKALYQKEIPNLIENDNSRVIEEEVEVLNLLSSFSVQTEAMLESYGFSENDWKELREKDESTFVLSGLIYLAIMDSNTEILPTTLKSRSENNGNEECLSLDRIMSCVGAVIGFNDIVSLLQGIDCITKATAYSVARTLASRIMGAASIAVFMYSFANCIGWI